MCKLIDDKKEIWKDIKGYEGLYQISNLGRVKSIKRVVARGTNYKPIKERVLKAGNNKGYAYVILCKYGKKKTVQVHRLVAYAFIPNPNNLPCINHKDENPLNNIVSNLEWCTHSYNNSYNELRVKAAISKRIPVLQYSKEGVFIREWSYSKEAEKELGISHRTIDACCKGKLKTSGGYIWKRKNSIV